MTLRTRMTMLALLPGLALAGAETPVKPAPPMPGMATYYLVLLHRGKAPAPADPTAAQRIQEGHMANIRRLHSDGKLVLAGPFENEGDLRGLFLLKASSREEAEALVATDPAVKAGRLEGEIRTWWGPAVIRADDRPPSPPAAAPAAATSSSQPSSTGERPTPQSLPPELDRVLRDYERAWRAKDLAALSMLFAEDGYVMASTKPPARGRQAIQTAYAGMGGPLWLQAIHHETQGDTGYMLGVYGHQEGEAPTGKFVLALKRVEGRWLIAADMDNSIRPPAR